MLRGKSDELGSKNSLGLWTDGLARAATADAEAEGPKVNDCRRWLISPALARVE